MTTLLLALLADLAAIPAFAHPGHGVPGWLHHGELAIVGAVVLAGLLARRVAAGRTRSRRD
jgi:hypothetical protein